MLGLALAIDYSLFIVSRFREELRRGRTVGEAVETAVATPARPSRSAGIAVAIGLSGLLLFAAAAIRSIGIGGALVVLCSVLYALTFLPAVLGMLGHRVNSLPSAGSSAASGPAADGAGARRTSRWERVAHGVMRRPLAVLVPTLAILLDRRVAVPAAPAGRARARRSTRPASRAATPTSRSRPSSHRARRHRSSSSPTSRATRPIRREHRGAQRVRRRDRRRSTGIDRVEGPFSLTDPATGAALTPDQVAALLRAAGRPTARAGSTRSLRALRPRFDRPTRRHQPARRRPAAATGLIPADPRDLPGGGITTAGRRQRRGRPRLPGRPRRERAPWAVGLTLIASAVILFLLFGSVVIPLKAVVMTLLSISASFGALVWIFQEGNLAGVLHFQPLGYTIAGNPIIMFSVIFGLSMDYEVLLLSRIQEAYRRTGDNTASVAEGLARTAGVITGAALIMVTRLRRVRPGRCDHDQEHRRGHGDRGVRRRDDHPGPARAGDDAPHGPLELVGARAPWPPRRSPRVQPRRGRAEDRHRRRSPRPAAASRM